MANGLGDFASLLGQAYSQSARQREDDYESNRRKAQRQQLLTMFAAPIVQGLGKGVVDFAGDLFLGDNSKDFFSTREGASFERRLSDIKKPLDTLIAQRDQLLKASKGQSTVEGWLNMAQESKRQQFEDEFGQADNYKTLIGAATFSPTEKERKEAEIQVGELESLISDLSTATDLNTKELLARYGQTRLGKGRGRRIASRMAAFFKGQDYNEAMVDPSVDYMLTKGDLSLRDSEFYRLMQNKDGTFKDDLRELVSTASDVGLSTSDQFDNLFEEFKRNNPDVARVLTDDIDRKRRLATERADVMSLAESNSQVAIVISQLDKEKIPVTQSNIKARLLDQVNGFSEEAEFANRFYNNEDNALIIENMRNGIAERTYGRAANDDESAFDAITNINNKNAINDEVKRYLTEAVKEFNNDLIEVTTDLKDTNLFDIGSKTVTVGGIRVLANDYLRAMLDPQGPHLVTREFDIPSKSWVQALTGDDTADLMSGTISNKDGLREIIRSALTNEEKALSNEQTANKTGEAAIGRKAQRRRQGLETSSVFNVRSVENDAEEIKTSLTLTDEEKERELNKFFSGFENYYETNPEVKQQIQQLRLKYLSIDPYREAQLMRGQIRRSD